MRYPVIALPPSGGTDQLRCTPLELPGDAERVGAPGAVAAGGGEGDPAIFAATSWRIEGRSAYSVPPGQSVAAQSRCPGMLGSNFCVPFTGFVEVDLAC